MDTRCLEVSGSLKVFRTLGNFETRTRGILDNFREIVQKHCYLSNLDPGCLGDLRDSGNLSNS